MFKDEVFLFFLNKKKEYFIKLFIIISIDILVYKGRFNFLKEG